tara:strand:+ start:170 stop:463 length:294 start_codon:yes stop_codon:yes gene_type:complete
MINNIIIISTLFYFLSKLNRDEQLLHMPSFEKYCGYKPSIDYLMNIIKDMQLCVDGYTPKSIIITKNNYNNNNKDICTFNIICSKKNIDVPQLILNL